MPSKKAVASKAVSGSPGYANNQNVSNRASAAAGFIQAHHGGALTVLPPLLSLSNSFLPGSHFPTHLMVTQLWSAGMGIDA